MERRYALFFSLAITLFIAFNYFWFFDKNNVERERVIVGRAIDGDTLELEDGRTIRLIGINTPEKNERGYEEAKSFLVLLENRSVEIEILGTEKYGRLLGEIYSPDSVNREILEKGFAHTLLVDDKHAKDFMEVQKRAHDNEVGIWKRSKWYGCLKVEVKDKEEYVEIEDSCNLDWKDWILKDETTNKYVFKKDMPSSFRVYSGDGIDNENKAYWKRGNAWNDDRDSVFILDNDELIVYYSSYGY